MFISITFVAEYGEAVTSLKPGFCESLLSQGFEVLISSIFVPLICYSLFMFFLNMPEFYSKTINKLASFSLGIYMIHDASILQFYFWNKILCINRIYLSQYFLLYAFAYTILIYFFGSIVDLVRQKIQTKIEPMIIGKINDFIENHSI